MYKSEIGHLDFWIMQRFEQCIMQIRSANNAEIRLVYNTEISHVEMRDWSSTFLDNAEIRIWGGYD